MTQCAKFIELRPKRITNEDQQNLNTTDKYTFLDITN